VPATAVCLNNLLKSHTGKMFKEHLQKKKDKARMIEIKNLNCTPTETSMRLLTLTIVMILAYCLELTSGDLTKNDLEMMEHEKANLPQNSTPPVFTP
jgi:hypothetical protein